MKKVDLIANEWVEVTDKDCSFQNRSRGAVFIFEGEEAPNNTDECFIITKDNIYNFTSNGKKMFAMCSGVNGSIIISN